MTMTLDEYRKCRLDWHYYHDSNLTRKEMAKMIVCANETTDEWFMIAMREYRRAKQLEELLFCKERRDDCQTKDPEQGSEDKDSKVEP